MISVCICGPSVGFGITLALVSAGIAKAAGFATSRRVREDEIPSSVVMMSALTQLHVYGVVD